MEKILNDLNNIIENYNKTLQQQCKSTAKKTPVSTPKKTVTTNTDNTDKNYNTGTENLKKEIKETENNTQIVIEKDGEYTDQTVINNGLSDLLKYMKQKKKNK